MTLVIIHTNKDVEFVVEAEEIVSAKSEGVNPKIIFKQGKQFCVITHNMSKLYDLNDDLSHKLVDKDDMIITTDKGQVVLSRTYGIFISYDVVDVIRIIEVDSETPKQ